MKKISIKYPVNNKVIIVPIPIEPPSKTPITITTPSIIGLIILTSILYLLTKANVNESLGPAPILEDMYNEQPKANSMIAINEVAIFKIRVSGVLNKGSVKSMDIPVMTIFKIEPIPGKTLKKKDANIITKPTIMLISPIS